MTAVPLYHARQKRPDHLKIKRNEIRKKKTDKIFVNFELFFFYGRATDGSDGNRVFSPGARTAEQNGPGVNAPAEKSKFGFETVPVARARHGSRPEPTVRRSFVDRFERIENEKPKIVFFTFSGARVNVSIVVASTRLFTIPAVSDRLHKSTNERFPGEKCNRKSKC